MPQEMTVAIKQVYGKEMIYPADDVSEAFCKLVRQQTLSADQVSMIKNLGYIINVQQPKLPQTL